MASPEAELRDAATVIVVRDPGGRPSVLMGQRGRGAVFMPGKFVFPGGAVDAADAEAGLAGGIAEPCRSRLLAEAAGAAPGALAAAAVRELWEETGHILGRPGAWRAPPGWESFAAAGYRPDASALSFFFRAVTPPGRPRRFDARFFLVDAAALATDRERPGPGDGELSHLAWVPLAEARDLDLAFVTQVVLAELARHLPSTGAPERVAFVRNDRIDSRVIWL